MTEKIALEHQKITVILLPGMDGTGDLFSPFIESFPEEWEARVVSYPDDHSLGYNELSSMIKKYIPATGDFIILGESFSGPLAIHLTQEADERLKGLILCCTFVKNPIKFGSEAIRVLAKFPLSFVPKSLIESFLLGSFRTQETKNLLHKTLKKVSAKTIVKRIREAQDVDVSDLITEVKAPILYLKASEDRIVSARASELAVSLNQTILITEIDGPHCLLQAAPTAALDAILSFLDT